MKSIVDGDRKDHRFGECFAYLFIALDGRSASPGGVAAAVHTGRLRLSKMRSINNHLVNKKKTYVK